MPSTIVTYQTSPKPIFTTIRTECEAVSLAFEPVQYKTSRMEFKAISLAFYPKPIFITSRAATSITLMECKATSLTFDTKPIFITSRAPTSLAFEPVQYKTLRAECEAASLAFKLIQYKLHNIMYVAVQLVQIAV